jgi:hypothetical protein
MRAIKADIVGVSLAGGVFVSGVLYYVFRWAEGASRSEVRVLGAFVFLLGFLVMGAAYIAGLYSLGSMPLNDERLVQSQKLKATFRKAVVAFGGCFLLYVAIVAILLVLKL